MRPLRRTLFPLAAALGAAMVVLPAIAGSETTPTITAVNQPGGGYFGESHAWSPATATVGSGGVVAISNPTEARHGVDWVADPVAPACSSGVPTSTSAETSGKNWTGTCTFAKPGTYTFYCTVHGPEMTGTVTVAADGTTSMSMSSPSTEATSTAGAGSSPAPSTPPSPLTPGAPATSGSSQPASPLAGSASSAIELPPTQHGDSVRGSVEVSSAGSGGRLEVQLLAKRASLASGGRASQVRVGHLVRSSLHAGAAGFTVSLDAKARRALRAHRRLAVSVKILLMAPGGPAIAILRRVVLRG